MDTVPPTYYHDQLILLLKCLGTSLIESTILASIFTLIAITKLNGEFSLSAFLIMILIFNHFAYAVLIMFKNEMSTSVFKALVMLIKWILNLFISIAYFPISCFFDGVFGIAIGICALMVSLIPIAILFLFIGIWGLFSGVYSIIYTVYCIIMFFAEKKCGSFEREFIEESNKGVFVISIIFFILPILLIATAIH